MGKASEQDQFGHARGVLRIATTGDTLRLEAQGGMKVARAEWLSEEIRVERGADGDLHWLELRAPEVRHLGVKHTEGFLRARLRHVRRRVAEAVAQLAKHRTGSPVNC